MAHVSPWARSMHTHISLNGPHPAGIPQVHHFGQEGLHNVLVIDLLGANLEELFDICGRKFTIKTVCMAAKQMVSVPSQSLSRNVRPAILVSITLVESIAMWFGFPSLLPPAWATLFCPVLRVHCSHRPARRSRVYRQYMTSH
jgi:hypothetical protein